MSWTNLNHLMQYETLNYMNCANVFEKSYRALWMFLVQILFMKKLNRLLYYWGLYWQQCVKSFSVDSASDLSRVKWIIHWNPSSIQASLLQFNVPSFLREKLKYLPIWWVQPTCLDCSICNRKACHVRPVAGYRAVVAGKKSSPDACKVFKLELHVQLHFKERYWALPRNVQFVGFIGFSILKWSRRYYDWYAWCFLQIISL